MIEADSFNPSIVDDVNYASAGADGRLLLNWRQQTPFNHHTNTKESDIVQLVLAGRVKAAVIIALHSNR